MSFSVVIVSGKRLIADAIEALILECEPNASCTHADDVAELDRALARSPGVVVVDLDGPGLRVDRLVSTIGNSAVPRRIGLYDSFTAGSAQTAFELGVNVLVPLTSPIASIVDAVLGRTNTASATSVEGLTPDQLQRLGRLTGRELEVLRHLAEGRSRAEIARLLGITEHTVNAHKRHAFEKLDVRHQAHAVSLVVAAGLVEAG